MRRLDPPDMAAMGRRRKRAAREVERALRHAGTAVAHARDRPESSWDAFWAYYIAGVITGAPLLATIGAALEMMR